MPDAPPEHKYVPAAGEEVLLFISKAKPVPQQGTYFPVRLGQNYYCVIITDDAIDIHSFTVRRIFIDADGNLKLTEASSLFKRPRHMGWEHPVKGVPKWLMQLTNKFVITAPTSFRAEPELMRTAPGRYIYL